MCLYDLFISIPIILQDKLNLIDFIYLFHLND